LNVEAGILQGRVLTIQPHGGLLLEPPTTACSHLGLVNVRHLMPEGIEPDLIH